MSRVFTNGPGDQGSILGRVIPKIQKMVLDASLFNTQVCVCVCVCVYIYIYIYIYIYVIFPTYEH